MGWSDWSYVKKGAIVGIILALPIAFLASAGLAVNGIVGGLTGGGGADLSNPSVWIGLISIIILFWIFLSIVLGIIGIIFGSCYGLIIKKLLTPINSNEINQNKSNSWLVGGIKASLIWIALFILYVLGYFVSDARDYFHDSLSTFFIFLFIFFVTGAFIGFIVGKIKD